MHPASNDMGLREAALDYADRGFSVFPLKPRAKVPATAHGFRDATTDAGRVERWWSDMPDANIGCATGAASGGVFAIDIDVDAAKGKDGRIALRAWEEEHGKLPETLTAVTGRGGLHLYYRSSQPVRTTACAEKSIDVRGDGGYVVLPPSMHENGNAYRWTDGRGAGGIADADENVMAFISTLHGGKSRRRYAMPDKVSEGGRNDALLSYVGKAQDAGLPDERIGAYAQEFNRTRCVPPLPADEVGKVVDSGLSYEKGRSFGCADDFFAGVERMPRNEKEYSRIFGKWLAGKVCYVPEEKAYRVWDGRHWVRDNDSQRVNRLCKRFVDGLIAYGQTSPSIGEDARSAFIQFANRYNRLADRKKLIEDARCEVTKPRAEFDADPNLLNLQNGTLDLATFRLRPHDPDDFISKVANVAYDESANCEEWERFLNEALQGDAEAIRYLQKVLALGLTCDTSQECMFILLGPTRSGKSTTVETLQTLLNPDDNGYARACSPETFAVRRYDDASRPSSDIARLNGCRFLVTSEPPKNMLFNVARLKQLTGRDMVTARFLHENEIQFRPSFTLVMTANNAPKVNDQTLFESNRVFVIPFENHLDADRRDTGLKDRLALDASLSGVLNWCLDGLKAFREEGLQPPMAVTLATLQYSLASDKISTFMGECLLPADDCNISGKRVYELYREWCRDSGLCAEGKSGFFQELRERGLLADTGTVNGKTMRNVVTGYREEGIAIE